MDAMNRLVLVQCAAPNEDLAEAISLALLDQALAACVHVRQVRSRYVWKGLGQSKIEHVLDIKTASRHFEAVASLIRSMHPYALPGIWVLPIETATPEYEAWVRACTEPAS
jgi:periplasmic divalent cation tolerance protein